MAILLRRVLVRGTGERVFVDTELQGNLFTVGSSANNSLQILGMGIEEDHAEIRFDPKSGQSQLRTFGRALCVHNGKAVQRQTLVVGDRVEIGANQIQLLDPPEGFDLALQLQLEDSGVEVDLELSHRTRLDKTWLSQRALAWTLVAAVCSFGLAWPLLFGASKSGQEVAFHPSEVWSAGPLHLAHQEATGGNCNLCHAKAFVQVQDSACTQCHTGTLDHPQLQTDQQETLGSVTTQDQQPPRCASCHLEHSEPALVISPATNHCSSCHQVTDLGKDHPEFGSYPNLGRTRILFDHQQHAGKHFGKTQKAFECASCHQLDGQGQHMMAGSFQSACVDCHGAKSSTRPDVLFHHGDQIADSAVVSFFNLPRLDLKTLEAGEAGTQLGYWPPETKGGSRAGLSRLGLTPVAELLLSTDPQISEALERLRKKKTKLASLRRAKPEEQLAVVTIANALQRLLAQLADNPKATLATRLEPMLSRELQPQELDALAGGLTALNVQQAARQWYAQAPDLKSAKSVQRFLDPSDPKVLEPVANRLATQAPGLGGLQLGSWEQQKFALHYNLSGHGDDFVRAWIALTSELLTNPAGDATPAGFGASLTAVQEQMADGDAKPGASKGLGRCTKCHDLPQSDPQALFAVSAWQASWRQRTGRSPARFTHQSHLRGAEGTTLLDNETCGQCHQANQDANYLAEAYVPQDPAAAQTPHPSNFQALSPGQCAQCHKPKTAASNACLQCHSYHPHWPAVATDP